jgi:alpha-L-fucosidase 2
MEKRPQPGCLGIPGFAWPDTVLAPKPGQIGWYHRNVESPWLASLKLQKADAIAATEQDPILNRTWGAILRGENFVSASPSELKTANPAPALSLCVHVLTRITDTAYPRRRNIAA